MLPRAAGYGAVVTTTPPDTRDPDAYYVAIGQDRFLPTVHTEGAWSGDQQHMAPISGLLVDALERHAPRPDLVTSRVTFDILGVIPMTEVELSARVIRPGRTIELVEAQMIAAGRPVVRATAWRLQTSDTSAVAGQEYQPMPPREECDALDVPSIWPGGFIRSLEYRSAPGRKPGHAQVWMRSKVDLIADRPTGSLAGAFALIDAANGIAVRCRPGEVLFPNTDLTVHLFRQPAGEWLGLDVEVAFGTDGTGLTAAVLHDDHGPFGRAAQTLTVRPLT